MARNFFIGYLAFTLAHCLLTSGAFSCGTAAGSESTQVTQSSCSSEGCSGNACAPFSPQNGCGKPLSTPASGGCCVCLPGCCVFIVPDYRFELPARVETHWQKRLFNDPNFCPQAYAQAVWHPPAPEFKC